MSEDNNDNEDLEDIPVNNGFNILETLTDSIKWFQERIDSASSPEEFDLYSTLRNKSCEEYLSFIDCQMQVDRLSKMRAEAIFEIESDMLSTKVNFKSDMSLSDLEEIEENVVKGPWDDGDEPRKDD